MAYPFPKPQPLILLKVFDSSHLDFEKNVSFTVKSGLILIVAKMGMPESFSGWLFNLAYLKLLAYVF